MASVDIAVFLTYVRSEFLYEHREGQGYFSDAAPFAISSITNEFLKFHIVSEHTSFFNVPINAITNSKTAPILQEDVVSFFPCPDDQIETIQYEHLTNIGHCGIWKKDDSFWQLGNYVLTIEWTRAKQNLHLIELEDGNYVAWGSSHITWGEDVPSELPRYNI